ncbi:MAG: undecaprenyl-phosphate glucose phosphotransferase [Dysgonamonadaceae bacterium]|jgi:putative colanic acid biosynthesis UDP-glucose lipid carrier transferase|nr:undecaprenyl-phosphate glucose phosphotransferase [Dysgonamonadaceae bacterium]
MVRDKRGYGFLIKWLIGIGDLFILNLIFFTVYQLTGVYKIEDFNSKIRIIALLLNFCYFFAVYFVPIWIYKPVMYADKVVQRSLSVVAMHAILFFTCLFFLKLDDINQFPMYFILYFYFALFIIFPCWRIFARESLKHYRRTGKNYKRVIIVGAGKNGMNLYAEMKKENDYGFHIYGFFDDNILLKNTLPNYLGMTHEVEDFVLKNSIDEIYCTLPNSKDEKIMRIFNFAEKNMVRFYIIPEFSRYVKRRLTLESIESLPVMAVRIEPLQLAYNQIIKRTFDFFFSFIFLITLFPVLYVILGLLIKISSRGPVIFKQVRTGIYGKDFNCYKFRSMKQNEMADEKQAEKEDPRTTWIGRFLRRSNLDEIPQFYNVLKGDMSVVGPRPHMLKHTELYSTIIDKYMVRHLVKPGITGWAQVNGYRGETKTMEQMEGRVRYDVWYLENWTFLLDLKIIFVTIINMFKGEQNAY